MFRGQHLHAIDGKGRTTLPAEVRESLAHDNSRVVLSAGLDACVLCYPLEEWHAFEARLAALPRFDPHIVILRRLLVSSAEIVEFDKLGRVLVPQSLRAHAQLGKDVLWAGMGTHLELWSHAAFTTMKNRALEDVDLRAALANKLSELGL